MYRSCLDRLGLAVGAWMLVIVPNIPALRTLAQATATPNSAQTAEGTTLPTVADSPTAIHPTELLDARLTKNITNSFKETSLSDIAAWIQKETGFNVVLDQRSLETIDILPSEPITDSVSNAPIHLVLDRLASLGIEWRLSNGVLYLARIGDLSNVYTMQYNVGDLLDKKYDPEELVQAIEATVAPQSWGSEEINGRAVLLGDVLFVRQTPRTHRRVAGLLAALRKPARRVFVDDPEQHAPLRAALDRITNIQVKEKSLASVVEDLAKASASDIRLDRVSLKKLKLSDRVPVSLEVREQNLQTVLDVLTSQLKLTWILRDGILWITTADEAENNAKNAIFDVRDLCQTNDECNSLMDAIEQQSNPESWSNNGGIGQIAFPTPGIMVAYQTEANLNAVLALLENYRVALRNSKRRISPDKDPNVVETKYYRMPSAVAKDVAALLPEILFQDTWRSAERPAAIGTIRIVQSWDQFTDNKLASRPGETEKRPPVSVPFSVLIIEQKRAVHNEIPNILHRIEHGDTPANTAQGMGGAGFGGGFFSVPTTSLKP